MSSMSQNRAGKWRGVAEIVYLNLCETARALGEKKSIRNDILLTMRATRNEKSTELMGKHRVAAQRKQKWHQVQKIYR